MFQTLFGSLLNHLYHYASENVSVKHLSLICITFTLTTIYSLKNCSVYGRSCRIYSTKSFGFFWKEARAAFSRPRSQFFTIRTDPSPGNNIVLHVKLSNEMHRMNELLCRILCKEIWLFLLIHQKLWE